MSRVAIVQDDHLVYPDAPPFDPEEVYPELSRLSYRVTAGPANPVYAAVRRCFEQLGLDASRAGTAAWNPLGDVIRPGQRVLIKPNLVLHEPASLVGSNALVTHGSVIRAVTDYVLLAAGREGTVTIGDCPLQEADLPRLARASGLQGVLDHYAGHRDLPLRFVDFRTDRMVMHADGRITDREKLSGDPAGNVEVRLDGTSSLEPITRADAQFGAGYQQAFAVANYDKTRTVAHHVPGHHAYLIPRSVLEADVFVNVPKLKTHQKAGITVCQKNLIGINADKAYLPHYREGSAQEGGDEYPRRDRLTWWNRRVRAKLVDGNPLVWAVGSRLWRLAKSSVLTPRVLGQQSSFVANAWVSGGAWEGNDTLWRTILDINRILFFARADGRLHDAPVRRYVALVDGIMAGEGNGPILPHPKPAGALLLGTDPLGVDVVAARLMGFHWREVPQLRHAASLAGLRYSAFDGDVRALEICAGGSRWARLFDGDDHLGFDPPPFWPHLRLPQPVTFAAGERT